MKVSIATALSVVGVLAAGAAAYAVNVSVLDAPSASDSSLVSTTIATGGMATPVVSADSGAVSADGVKVNDTTTSYQVGTAGTVVVSIETGAVVVTSVVPNSGYTAEPARTEANGLVKVHFNSSTSRIEFTAQLVNGEVVVKVNNESLPGGAVTGTPAKPSFPGAGDDDDDDEDEHEERHHHDDDDGEHEFEGDDD